MNTKIELIFEKTEENKPFTNLYVKFLESTDIDIINLIYPQPEGLNENGEAQSWRENNYGARYLSFRGSRDYGDNIIISLFAEGGTAYSFFRELARKFPSFKGNAKIENNQSSVSQTWFIQNGQINHHFDDISWTETAKGFYIDYCIRTADNNELTAEEAEKVIKYHNQGSTYARVIVSVEFRSGMEVLAETEFYYSGIDEHGIHSHPEYLRALKIAQNAV